MTVVGQRGCVCIVGRMGGYIRSSSCKHHGDDSEWWTKERKSERKKVEKQIKLLEGRIKHLKTYINTL